MKNLAPLLPNVELSDDAILKSLDKYRPDAYFDGSRPVGGDTTDDINDLRDYYRYDPSFGHGKLTQPIAHIYLDVYLQWPRAEAESLEAMQPRE